VQVTFCVCKKIKLYSVLFCVLRAVRPFDWTRVINEKTNKWRTCKGQAVLGTYVANRPSSGVSKGLYPRCACQLIRLTDSALYLLTADVACPCYKNTTISPCSWPPSVFRTRQTRTNSLDER